MSSNLTAPIFLIYEDTCHHGDRYLLSCYNIVSSGRSNLRYAGVKGEEIMVKLTFLGHACFVIDDGTAKLIVDPFLTGNPAAAAAPEEIEADYVFVTHGHGDHLGDAVQIAERTGAVVCTSVDLAEAVFNGKGLKVEAGNMGGWIRFPFGRAKFFQAIHGSGAPGTLSSGFVFEIGGKKIYHAGDTALMTDMQLLEAEHIDAALLPIGDYYTMGPEDALRAAEMIKAGLTIPMHYNTFPHISQDGDAFVSALAAEGLNGAVLKPGELLEL